MSSSVTGTPAVGDGFLTLNQSLLIVLVTGVTVVIALVVLVIIACQYSKLTNKLKNSASDKNSAVLQKIMTTSTSNLAYNDACSNMPTNNKTGGNTNQGMVQTETMTLKAKLQLNDATDYVAPMRSPPPMNREDLDLADIYDDVSSDPYPQY
ncbi:uncharacterized protein LOC143445507 [Clavelina lepadiformis]|uniref:uncharacterized protein LOC143445507 n=1 Tax=Clavelina lepadiformis TaxID=159417 RepID=UPI0040416B04